MTLLWLIILGINGRHWSELHPWTTTFIVLIVCALLDSGIAASRNARR